MTDPMTITPTIASAWRCAAIERRGDRRGHRCAASGARYRDAGRWVCLRHMDALANDYVGDDRAEAARDTTERAW